MKKIVIIGLLFVFCSSAKSQISEYYFRFVEPNKDKINTTITRLVSIGKVVGDTVYAFANDEEFAQFQKLSYKYTVIPKPSLSNLKAYAMATTIDQMASWDRYPTYQVYRSMMKKFEYDYPNLCKLDSIGTTLNGRKIYVVKLSNNVASEEPEVEVLYTSTIHGDETTGYILMLRLIDYYLSNYSTDTKVTSMLNGMAIYINPLANPDGTYYGGDNNVDGARRSNSNGVDLNRNFPDPRVGLHPNGVWQTETQIFMNFASSRHFTLSANFHGGVEVFNFPWDAWTSSQKTHPDNNWFLKFARQYADLAQVGAPIGYFDYCDNGITEGGDWYVIEGGRQDYMNWWHHCREVTIELSNSYTLSPDLLPNFWSYNRNALISYLDAANEGFHGIVTNSTGNPLKAKVFIAGHDADSSHVYSSQTTGFYARPIEPGTWQVTYSAPGYISQTKPVTISNWDDSILQDVVLEIDQTGVFPNELTNKKQLNVWPNPFSDQIKCRFILDRPSSINLSIYSIDGRKVATIANEFYQTGSNTVVWNTPRGLLNSGSYVVVLMVGEKSYSQIIQYIP
jgi:hypothetical protein